MQFFKKNLSDIFDKTDEKCPNRPENQELGPILGQNGDPDLIKQFPTILTPKIPLKNQKWDKKSWKIIVKIIKDAENGSA